MQGENERQWKKKVNENRYDISSIKTFRWLLRSFDIIDKNHKGVVIEKKLWFGASPVDRLSTFRTTGASQCSSIQNVLTLPQSS